MPTPPHRLPPLLTQRERDALLWRPLAHLRMLRDGYGTRIELQALAGLFNIGSVAAQVKGDTRRLDIFLWGQTQLLMVTERTAPGMPVVLTDEEYEAMRKALVVMDAWLVTLPRARLQHAVAQIDQAQRRAELARQQK